MTGGALLRIRLLAAGLALLLAAPPASSHDAAGDRGAGHGRGFAAAVRAAAPSVVSIYATRVVESRASIFDSSPFFREFFRDFGGRRRLASSLGSGVVAGEDGIVITADHVIEGAREIRVALADRREYRAEVLLSDPRADLAVLKLPEAESLPALRSRSAEDLEIGDPVLAIGNPLGVGQTVTSGILSAVARTGGGGRYYLQTDAAINVGNSGGALVDTGGALVGINTAIVTRSGGSDGIGFAVPSNLAMLAVEAARRGEREIPRPWTGMEVQEVGPAMADALGMEAPRGVAVTRLDERGGFARAGLEVGDVVLAVGGRPIHAPHELDYHLALAGPGAAVRVAVGGREDALEIVLERAPEEPAGDAANLGRGAGPFSGSRVANASPALAERLGVPSVGVAGVMVVESKGESSRWLRPGDLVREVNGERVEDTRSLRQAIERAERRWRVVLERDGRMLRLRLGG